MSDPKTYSQVSRMTSSAGPTCNENYALQENSGAVDSGLKSGYFVASPNGMQIPIPKELYTAFSDFIKTRKCPGSIAIQFRSGEITCVEALARKTYRTNP
jgi:hypothetical protein